MGMIPKKWWQKRRIELGLRKVELAEKAGISVRTVFRLEAGDSSISEETKSKVRIVLSGK